MPYGAVFTSSSGGSIGGPLPFTRVRGQLLVGQSAEPPANAFQTGTAVGGATGYNGSAAAPLYSYYNVPNTGFYAFTQTTAAPDIRWSHSGVDVLQFTSGVVGLVSTAGITAAPSFVWGTTQGMISTAATDGFVYIPQTSAAIASSTGNPTTPTARSIAAAICWDSARSKLMVFSTVAGNWMGSGIFTSS